MSAVKVGQVESEGGDYQGGGGVYLPGRMRERMHLRQAEQRDVVSGRDVTVIGVLELLVDLQSLGALVVACPILFVAVYAYLHD